MRTIASLLLVGLLLFNWVGYQLFYSYLQHRSDSQLEAVFDKNTYNESDLLTIQVPLNVPYIQDEAGYQRIDGQITVNGIQYKYVKRRVFHDSLFLKCLPDKGKMQLASARNDYFKATADLPASGHSKDGHNSISFPFSEFVIKRYNWSPALPVVLSTPAGSQKVQPLSTISGDCPERPPQVSTPLI